MSQPTKKELTPLEELFKRLCANKETQKALLEALAAECVTSAEMYNHYAVAALFEEKNKADAFAALGVNTWLSNLHLRVSKF